MDDRIAYKLAETIHGTWPTTGPTRAVWYDLLQPLDEPMARAAYTTVRSGGAPRQGVLAAFNDEYHALQRRLARTGQQTIPCDRCDGTGMVTVWEEHGGQAYSAVAPCPSCDRPDVHRTLAAVITHNDGELDRDLPDRDRTYRRRLTPPDPAPWSGPRSDDP